MHFQSLVLFLGATLTVTGASARYTRADVLKDAQMDISINCDEKCLIGLGDLLLHELIESEPDVEINCSDDEPEHEAVYDHIGRPNVHPPEDSAPERYWYEYQPDSDRWVVLSDVDRMNDCACIEEHIECTDVPEEAPSKTEKLMNVQVESEAPQGPAVESLAEQFNRIAELIQSMSECAEGDKQCSGSQTEWTIHLSMPRA